MYILHQGAPSIKRNGLKSHLFRYNCSKNCCLASAKTAIFNFILTKNLSILSAVQFLQSNFIRISEKKTLHTCRIQGIFCRLGGWKNKAKTQPSLRRVAVTKFCLKIQSFRTISALKSAHRRQPYVLILPSFCTKNIEFEVRSS